MFKLCIAQIKKLFLRTDVLWILAIFAILPLGIALLISMESGIVQIGNSVFSAMGYSSVLVGLLSSLLLVSVTLALTATSLVSKEIDTGLDSMYVTKVKSRGHILLSKMVAMDLMAVAIFVVLVLSAVAGWALFLKNSSFGTDLFWGTDRNETFQLIYTILGAFFEALVMTRLYFLFSVLFKHGKALVFNFVIVVVLKLLANIEKVRMWIPSYIGSGMELTQYTGDELVRHGLSGLGLLAVYVVVLSVVNYWLYKKMDLSR